MAHTQGMGRPPLNIDIAKKDQLELRSLLKGGIQQVRVVLRALTLLQLAEHRVSVRFTMRAGMDGCSASLGARYRRSYHYVSGNKMVGVALPVMCPVRSRQRSCWMASAPRYDGKRNEIISLKEPGTSAARAFARHVSAFAGTHHLYWPA